VRSPPSPAVHGPGTGQKEASEHAEMTMFWRGEPVSTRVMTTGTVYRWPDDTCEFAFDPPPSGLPPGSQASWKRGIWA
jgi:hypothetical protein